MLRIYFYIFSSLVLVIHTLYWRTKNHEDVNKPRNKNLQFLQQQIRSFFLLSQKLILCILCVTLLPLFLLL